MESPFNFLAMSGIGIGATSIAADFCQLYLVFSFVPKILCEVLPCS